MRHRLGFRIPVSVRSTAIRNSSGQIVGAIEVFTNISTKKKIERRIGELEDLAYRDSLTGVANRRYTELKLQQATQEVQLFGRRIGLILMDLDRFKEVNDTCGHDAGDRVLLAVSRTLVGSLRPTDFIGRWGGEEFVVFVTDANAELLQRIAERCRMLIGATSVPLTDRESIQVTASMGATLLLPADSSQSAIARADKLMYESKTGGRNRITFSA
jgi:diguanylate cyclase (GGDEF)-like protein